MKDNLRKYINFNSMFEYILRSITIDAQESDANSGILELKSNSSEYCFELNEAKCTVKDNNIVFYFASDGFGNEIRRYKAIFNLEKNSFTSLEDISNASCNIKEPFNRPLNIPTEWHDGKGEIIDVYYFSQPSLADIMIANYNGYCPRCKEEDQAMFAHLNQCFKCLQSQKGKLRFFFSYEIHYELQVFINPIGKLLYLNLKKEWFKAISMGIKKEEYREIKKHWTTRLTSPINSSLLSFDYIIFRNGYAKNAPTMVVEFKGIRIGKGNSDWGAEPNKDYYCIQLGHILYDSTRIANNFY